MKSSLRHLLWIGVLLFSGVTSQAASYTIKPGDNLAKIARRHGCTAQELAKANGLSLSSVIHPGQTLKLPTKNATTGATAGAAASTSTAPAEGSHVIKDGETLSSVSRLYKIPLDSLVAANPGIDPKTLKVGQKIRLTAAAGTAPATPPPAPAVTQKKTPQVSESGSKKAESPDEEAPSGETESKIRTVMVEKELTFGEFAAQHGTDIARLNDLNGLDLTSATVLAKGSELYVPRQP